MTVVGRTVHYDAQYRTENYFRYREWLYGPYVSGLIAFCGLTRGSSVLDVGCGQGFFSYLFGQRGMRAHGIDVSETGIRSAERRYAGAGITFTVGDIDAVVFPERFDCLFVRSCSLYNTAAFPAHDDVTGRLLRHVKPNGVFIFAYNSNFSSRTSATWRYHSLEEVRQHFRRHPTAQAFFSSRLDTWLLRTHAFTPWVTRANVFLSRLSGIGGDLVCVVRNAGSA